MEEAIDIPIGDLVPHDPPMILIDAMLSGSETRSLCQVKITGDSLFLEAQGVPAYVGIEYMAQSIAAHGGYLAHRVNETVRVGFLLGSPQLRSHVTHFPLGQELRIEVKQDWGDEELMRYHCVITDAGSGEALQEAGLNVFHPRDLETYLDKNRD